MELLFILLTMMAAFIGLSVGYTLGQRSQAGDLATARQQTDAALAAFNVMEIANTKNVSTKLPFSPSSVMMRLRRVKACVIPAINGSKCTKQRPPNRNNSDPIRPYQQI